MAVMTPLCGQSVHKCQRASPCKLGFGVKNHCFTPCSNSGVKSVFNHQEKKKNEYQGSLFIAHSGLSKSLFPEPLTFSAP